MNYLFNKVSNINYNYSNYLLFVFLLLLGVPSTYSSSVLMYIFILFQERLQYIPKILKNSIIVGKKVKKTVLFLCFVFFFYVNK